MKRLKIPALIALIIMLCTVTVFGAVSSTWGSYTDIKRTDSYNDSGRNHFAWKNGLFYVNLYKGTAAPGTLISSVKVSVACQNATGTDGTNALYKNIWGNQKKYRFTQTHAGGSTGYLQVGTNSSTDYYSSKTAAGQSNGGYVYILPHFSVKIPTGYQFSTMAVGQDPTVVKAGSFLAPVTSSTSGVNFLAGKSGGTTATGYLGLATPTVGITNYSSGWTSDHYYHREYSSLNILLRPNKLSFNYYANGGTLDPSKTTGTVRYKVYNGGLIQRSADSGSSWANVFSAINYDSSSDIWDVDTLTQWGFGLKKTGYHVNANQEWNTKSDGTGTTFSQSQSKKAQDFLSTLGTADRTLALYANWKPNNYKLEFNPLNGTTSNTTTTVTQDAATNNRVGVATKEGYRFMGWYTAPIGGAQIYDETGVASNHGNSGYWSANGTSAKWVKPFADNTTIPLYAHWEVDLDGAYVKVLNTHVEQASGLKIRKADDTTYEPIQGVTFTLSGGSYNVSKTTGADGIAAWSDIPDGTYTLKETSWPEGYKEMMDGDMKDGVHPYKVVVQNHKTHVFAVSE